MKRPNVLLIACDQLRPDYLGCYGGKHAITPTIDALASRGTTFECAFTNAPICAPARIALATGLRPNRTGATDNAAYLPISRPTYYQRLRDHDYRVGCVGKLDLAKPDLQTSRTGDRPCVFGFGFTHPHEIMGRMDILQIHQAEPYDVEAYSAWLKDRGLFELFLNDYLSRKGPNWLEDHLKDSVLPTDAHQDSYIAQKSVEWIESISADKPWHLFVSFTGPHDPLDAPTSSAKLFRERPMPKHIEDDLEGKPEWVKRRARTFSYECDTPLRSKRQYSALIHNIDLGIARILDALERRGMTDETVILFTSDHGETLYDHGLPIGKHCAYESAMRIPLLAAGPGIAPGYRSNALVELIDVGETVCDIASISGDERNDALSVLPVLRSQRTEHRDHVITMETPYRALRTAQYKYIENLNDMTELYDLAEDPQELNNLAPKQPELLKRFRRQMKRSLLEGGTLR